MSLIGTIIDSLVTALSAAAPTSTVTRTMLDFAFRDEAELEAGVFTVISKGIEGNEPEEYLNLLLVGQVLVRASEDDTDPQAGDLLEEAEHTLLDQVHCFIRGAKGAQLKLGTVRQSMQLDRPYGWISVPLRVGPFDLGCLLDVATMDPFITFNADWDMAPPDGQIDATDNVTLEQ